MLLDVGERPGDLALVQFALTATWLHRNEYDGDLLQATASAAGINAGEVIKMIGWTFQVHAGGPCLICC